MLSLFRIILNSDGKESGLLSTERENPEQDRTGISRANVDSATPELQLHRKVYALPLPKKVILALTESPYQYSNYLA
jgi:hypothetical protein